MTYPTRSARALSAGRTRALALWFAGGLSWFGCGGDDEQATGGQHAGGPAPSGGGGTACVVRDDQLRLMPGSECKLSASDLSKYRIEGTDTVRCGSDGRLTLGALMAGRSIQLNGLEVTCGDS